MPAAQLKTALALAAAIAPIASLSLPASAATRYWDLNGTTAGAGTSPAGTWNNSALNWNPVDAGTDATVAFASGDAAVFSAGTDATGAFNVAVGAAQTAAGVTVE